MTWRPRRAPDRRIPLGTYRATVFRRFLRLSGDETQSHIHVIGKSGSGKSRWLAGFYVNLLRAGYTATLIDPHGDLAKLVLRQLVAEGFFDQEGAFDRLHYLDIPGGAKQGRYLRFNCLRQPYDVHTTTRLTLEALRRAFPALDGGVAPAFEQIVTAGVHTLVENDLPFPELRSVLLNKPLRDRLLERVPDPLVTSFFHEEYDRWDERERVTLRGSTMRRLFLLLYSPILRHALGAPDNLLEYRGILDRQQSLIVNLAIQDPDTKRLFGCLLTVFAEQGALSRADLPANERYGAHYLLLDEFHQWVAQSAEALAAMLSQTRKYRLFTVLAHQTRDQVPERMRGALQNVEVSVTFRTGREDAEQQAKIVGDVDPLSVKHEVRDESAVERTHPAFYSLPEQWERWTQAVVGLKKRSAFVKHPNGRVVKVQSLPMPDPNVDAERVATVEERYLRACFAPAPDASVEGAVSAISSTGPPRRVARGGPA
jgi:hypothetical protein